MSSGRILPATPRNSTARAKLRTRDWSDWVCC